MSTVTRFDAEAVDFTREVAMPERPASRCRLSIVVLVAALVVLGAAAPAQAILYVSIDVPRLLEDFLGPQTSTLFVPDSFAIADIDLIFNDLQHEFFPDLFGTLTSPAGTTVILLNQGSLPCPFVGIVQICSGLRLDDDGGGVDPVGALSAFDGQNTQGTWMLTLTDLSAGDAGVLTGWSLDISPVPEPSMLALIGSGAVGLGALLRRRRHR